MQQALAILALYLSALAVGQGIPMNNFIPPPRPPHPPPVELIATNLHKNCKDFEISSARRDGSVRRPGSPGSPDSTASYSGSEARRMRRADDVDGDVLIANCKNPQGIVHEVTLSLNRCFGWDPENIGLTAQLKEADASIVDMREGHSHPILVHYSVPARQTHDYNNQTITLGGVIQYNARSGLISCHGVEGTDLGPVPPPPRGDEAV
ncbi:hypothetical protein ANOM_009495 [Aspergillus nomiae NRRL 13137]|uniref:Cyanovirin-N domain-containing protein n=1 Tax=Aspergillus nomiae NRRL (strain ATCC 15546 / NRRL 13137 / CBS 260.88 / M93) TaxID=1509407 RepID=A0A0L1IXX0_ASPN3|nr:uncharacterized protein ANOM_009495 [Aspergillus nomiae NRRL 13137]KNG84349.1 hypothetical protein ANOM_009495 [Aspergillus nomiae NRRL 13137]